MKITNKQRSHMRNKTIGRPEHLGHTQPEPLPTYVPSAVESPIILMIVVTAALWLVSVLAA